MNIIHLASQDHDMVSMILLIVGGIFLFSLLGLCAAIFFLVRYFRKKKKEES